MVSGEIMAGLTDAEIEALEKQEKGLTDAEIEALEHAQGGKAQPSRAGEAALESFGKQASFGYLPQLQAGVSRIIPDPAAAINERLRRQGFRIETPSDSYVGSRDEFISRGRELSKQHPTASLVGGLAGAATGGAAVPAGIMGGAGSLLARVGKSAAAGAALGAVESPEDIKGEVSPLQIRERLASAGMGGAIGAATPVVGAAVKKAGSLAFQGIKKSLAEASGIAEKAMETYAKKTKQVDDIIRRSGGDITDEADRLRETLSKGIQQSKQKLGRQIGDALEQYPNTKAIDAGKITESLDRWKNRLDADYQGEQIAEIQGMIDKIKKKGEALSIQDLNKTVDFLQESAKPSYLRGGQIFARGNEAAKAAKSAAAEARRMLNDLAPEVKQANSKLAQMHQIESRLNRNLLRAGSPEAALLAAGAGTNTRNARMLQALEAVSGVPVAERASELAAAKAFGNAPLFSALQTGKALLGGSLGYGIGGQEGAAIGAALTSPAVLRRAIQAGGIIGRRLPGAPASDILRNQVLLNRLRALEGGE